MIKENEETFSYGSFKNGELEYRGLSFKGKDLYYGEWKHGKLECQPGLELTSRDLYFGGWEDGQKDGEGIYLKRNSGKITKGNWKSGFLEGKMNSLSKDKLECEIWENKQPKEKVYTFDLNDKTITRYKEEKKA